MSCSTCNNKNCNNSSLCGCKDTYLTSPLPCPTPVACPAAQPCSETFDSQCIVYTGLPLTCDEDTVVATNTNVAEALADIIDYFCNNITPTASAYEYIDSFFATGDEFITSTSWYVPTNFAGFVYTADYTGKYKITLTARCTDEDADSGADIGLGINSADPVGTGSSNPFIIKTFRGVYGVQTHTYIINLTLGDIMRLKFKSTSSAVMGIDPLYMTIEKISN
jgi:hypothetical protein